MRKPLLLVLLFPVMTLAQASFSPTSVSFGSVAVGTISGPQAVTMTNTSGVSMTPTLIWQGTQSDFGAAWQGDCFLDPNHTTTTIPNAGTCTINVYFAPSTTGARSGTICVNSNLAQVCFNVSGSGTAASTTVQPTLPTGVTTADTFPQWKTFSGHTVDYTWPNTSGYLQYAVYKTCPGAYTQSTTFCPTNPLGAGHLYPQDALVAAAANCGSSGVGISVNAGDTFTDADLGPGSYLETQVSTCSAGKWIIMYSSDCSLTDGSCAHIQAPVQSLVRANIPRVQAFNTAYMPHFVTTGSAITMYTAFQSSHYRFVGIEWTHTAGTHDNFGFAYLGLNHSGSQPSSVADLPTYFVFDRNYLHGDYNDLSLMMQYRAISLGGNYVAAINNYVTNILGMQNSEVQCFDGVNMQGPVEVWNNFCEAAGENYEFGGADPLLPAPNLPSDIYIHNNVFSKNPAWIPTDPAFDTVHYSASPANLHPRIKNSGEFKVGRRLLITGNIYENNVNDAQNGFAIVFTNRSQSGTNPWNTVSDVTFVYNEIRDSHSGINMLLQDDKLMSLPGQRWLFANNLFRQMGPFTRWIGAPGCCSPYMFQWSGMSFNGGDWPGAPYQKSSIYQALGITMDHNSFFGPTIGGAAIGVNQAPIYDYTQLTNSFYDMSNYGFTADVIGPGNVVFADFFTANSTRADNLFSHSDGGTYTSGQFDVVPSSSWGLANYSACNDSSQSISNCALLNTSAYFAAGTDGKPLGADVAGLNCIIYAVGCSSSTTVNVTPTTANLPYGGIQQYTANPTPVTWTADAGTITSAGIFTAPASTGTVTITATPSVGTAGTATAVVSALAVTPNTVTLNVGGTQQFSANFPSAWAATGGTISGSGLYTAPSVNGTYTITATATNGGSTATATVTVTGQQTFIPLSISPSSWTQQTTISTPITKTFTATNVGTGSVTPTVTLTGSAKFSISANTCTGAVSGGGNCTVTVQFTSATVGSFSGNLNISDTAGGNQNLPLNVSIPSGTTVSISPLTATIPINGTLQFSATTSNGSSVTWATNCTGSSVTAGFFTAGGSADLCTVTATTTDGSGANAIASVTLVTVAVNPSAVTLQILSAQQFSANVAVTWSASCGTITAAGQYTAPGAPASCTITATATNGGATGTATATIVNPPPGTKGGKHNGKGNPHKFS